VINLMWIRLVVNLLFLAGEKMKENGRKWDFSGFCFLWLLSF
jgi:hypothetical protein